jgi:hypothetical protein
MSCGRSCVGGVAVLIVQIPDGHLLAKTKWCLQLIHSQVRLDEAMSAREKLAWNFEEDRHNSASIEIQAEVS